MYVSFFAFRAISLIVYCFESFFCALPALFRDPEGTRSAQKRMIGALAAHILLDERSVEITDRGEFEVPSAELKTGGH